MWDHGRIDCGPMSREGGGVIAQLNGESALPRSAGPGPGAASGPAESECARARCLFWRYSRCGDTAARDELVGRILPLAHRLARRYRGGPEPLDDLTQVASIGLLNGIDRFDPERGTGFAAFAIPTIVAELRHCFRDFGWAVHVMRRDQSRALAVERIAEERHSGSVVRPLASLSQRLGFPRAGSSTRPRPLPRPIPHRSTVSSAWRSMTRGATASASRATNEKLDRVEWGRHRPVPPRPAANSA